MSIKAPYDGFTYLDHQVSGVQWMMGREAFDAPHCRGGILGDDMGLGKTWQTIGLLINAPVAQTLIVTPPVLMGQWSAALAKSGIACCVVGTKGAVLGSSPVVLSTYGRIKTYNAQLAAIDWDRIILDEGQYIRNGPKTQRFQSVSRLSGVRRWVLSGTPVQNKVGDFKNLALWLGCSKDDIKKRNLPELAPKIIMRRSITLLADKMPPAPTQHAHKLDFMSAAELHKFKSLVGAVEDAIEKQIGGMLILERYLRLQQFIAHPKIYMGAMKRKFMGDYAQPDWTHGGTKASAFRDLMAAAKAPTLVFYNFTQEREILHAIAKRQGYAVRYVSGGMTEKLRTAHIEDSRSLAAAGTPVVLLCQITAGNCGLNLQHLTRVIFYTQHWNPAVIDQALARSYRYGQTNPVTVHHLVLVSPELLNIDRLMLDKHKEKRFSAAWVMPSLEFAYHPEISID
jgi:SNF2 family DNA or RNA helicase